MKKIQKRYFLIFFICLLSAYFFFIPYPNKKNEYKLKEKKQKTWVVLRGIPGDRECLEVTKYMRGSKVICFHGNKPKIVIGKEVKVIQLNKRRWDHEVDLELNLLAEIMKNKPKVVVLKKFEDFEKMKWKVKIFSEEFFYSLENETLSSDLYFGCQEPNDHQTFNFSLCNSSDFQGIHTPAVVSSPTNLCDQSMPDIKVEKGFVPLVFEDSFYSECSFPFLPFSVISDQSWFSNSNASCLVTHLLRNLGCGVAVHWSSKNFSNRFNPNFSQLCQSINKLPECSFYRNTKECFLDILKRKLNLQVGRIIEKWLDFLTEEKIEIKTKKFKKKCSQVIFPPQKISKSSENFWSILNYKTSKKTYEEICKKNVTKPYPGKSIIQNGDVMLLFLFNNPFYQVIPLLEIMYRPIYPFISYCGPTYPNSTLTSKYKFTFLQYDQIPGTLRGHRNYECVMKLLSLRLNHSGVLVIADDIFLNKNLSDLPVNKSWVPGIGFKHDLIKGKNCIGTNCTFKTGWIWWGPNKKGLLKIKEKWEALSAFDSFFNKTRQVMLENTLNPNVFYGNTADFYYIPKKHFEGFSKMINFYFEEKIFLEIAVPSVYASLDFPEDQISLNAHCDWSSNRNKPYIFVNKKNMQNKYFAHPVKLSEVLKQKPEFVDFFCNCITPYLVSNAELCSR